MYGKMVNNELKIFENPIKTEAADIFTNDASVITAHGYKEVVFTDEPVYEEGLVPVCTWEETDTQIVQVWSSYNPEDYYNGNGGE